MSKFCLDCAHWDKVAPIAGDAFGICLSDAVGMKVALDGKTKLGEEGTLWTSAYFGCVHWAMETNNSLIDLDEVINQDSEEESDEDE